MTQFHVWSVQTVAAGSRGAVVDVQLARDAREPLETRAAVARLVGVGGALRRDDRRADAAVQTRAVLYVHHMHCTPLSTAPASHHTHSLTHTHTHIRLTALCPGPG